MKNQRKRRTDGLSASEARQTRKIRPEDLRVIMSGVAQTIREPGKFTNDALSLNASGKSCDVYSEEAVQRDLLGWICKLSYEHWQHMRNGRKTIGYVVSLFIDSHIRTVSNGESRLMSIGDMGAQKAADYLCFAASKLSAEGLPALFGYAGDYESEEDRAKRLEKQRLRKEMREQKLREKLEAEHG